MNQTIKLDTRKCDGAYGKARIATLRRGERNNALLTVKVCANGHPYDLAGKTASLVATTAAGKLVGPCPMEVDEAGIARIMLPAALYSAVGSFSGYVEIREGETLVDTTDRFGGKVIECADLDSEQAAEFTPLLGELQNAVAEEAKRVEDEKDRAQAETERETGFAEAKQAAQTATTAANDAAEGARSAAGSASDAAESANTAAGKATDAAGLAETAKTNANTAAEEANAAATKAEAAARKADGAAETAGTAASTAELAANKADTAAGNAESMAEKAKTSAEKADTASDKAYKSVDAAKSATTDANKAAEQANSAAESASIAALDARAAALEARGNPPQPTWDEAKQRYTNETMAAYAHSHRDGKIYGVKIPKSIITDCIKIGAAEGIASPVPGTIGTPCVDPFTAMGKGPHWHEDVCGGADPDGSPFVDGIEGDGRFSLTDNGQGNNVYVMSNVIWQKFEEDVDPDYIWWFYSDTRKGGYEPNPQAFLPDGTLRPYMLTPKYGASKDAKGNLRSVSGAPLYVRNLSHDSGIDEAKTATTGYSLKSVYDDWYIKFSYITRYGTKNFQKMFTGCSSYNVQVAPVLAETGVKRVVVSATDAEKFIDGSCVSLGTHDTGNSGASVGADRNTSKNYDVFDMKRIVSHETLADGNVALNIECDSAFDTGTSYMLSTMPWWTGSTDAVEGEGSPSSNTSGKEPCKVGGVELMYGAYELVHGAMQKSVGDGWYIVINPDSRNEKKGAVANGAIETGVRLVDDGTWPITITDAHGLLVGQGNGGNSNSGLCDCSYNSKPTDKGLREHLTSGSLWGGSSAGPWCVSGGNWLDGAGWIFCSRLSATGRGGEEAQAAKAA